MRAQDEWSPEGSQRIRESEQMHRYVGRLYALTASLSRSLTSEEVARTVLAEGVPALEASEGLLSVITNDGSSLQLLDSLGYLAERTQRWQNIPVSADLPLAEAVRSGQSIWIESPEQLGQEHPALQGEAPGTQSAAWAILPLMLEGRALGGITFGFSKPRKFTIEDSDFAAALANQGAQALERARLYESEKLARLAAETSQRRFAFLAAASEVFAQSASREEIFENIVKLVIPRLADWMTLRIIADNGELLAPVTAHVDPSLHGPLLELQRTFRISAQDEHGAGRVLKTGVPEFYPTIAPSLLESALGPVVAAQFARVGMRGALTVPLRAQGATLGILTLASATGDRQFTKDDLLLAEDFARRIALAIDNARIREKEQAARAQAQEASRRANFLAQASEAFATSLDYKETLKRLVELAVPEVADYCYVDIREEGKTRRLTIAHHDTAKLDLAWRMAREYPLPEDSSRGWPVVLRTGKSRVAEISDSALIETARDETHLQLMRSLHLRSVMAVPLQAQGKTLGVISFFSTESGRVFTAADLPFAEDLARRAALAMENAWLHRAEHEARQQAEQAARRTARLQQMTSAMSEAATPIQVAQAVLTQAREALGAINGAVWERQSENDFLELIHAENYPSTARVHFQRIPLSADVPIAEASRTGAPIWLESRQDYRTRYPEAEAVTDSPEADYSAACLPLYTGFRSIGGLALTFRGARRFGSEEHNFLSALATQCAHALDRARLYREAQEAIAVRDEFLSIASHELKTPLTVLKLHIQTALSARGNPPLEKLRRADKQIAKLTDLIEEMLDLSRIRTGKLKLNLEMVDVVAVARNVLSGFEEEFQRTGSILRFQSVPEAQGMWDRLRIEQVLTNLISNALKYGNGEPIEVDIQSEQGLGTLRVTDHGIGVSKADADRLFNRFQRARSARNFGGLGLGLYICRQIVEAMGGTIRMESQEGVGSSFYVNLPLTPAPRSSG